MTRKRLQKIDPLDTARYASQDGMPGNCSHLEQLTIRLGPRPAIGVHPVPNRQLNQIPNAAMKQKIEALFDAVVAARPEVIHYKLSFFEKRNKAVTLIRPDTGHEQARAPHGEIAHVHPSDGSMHMILSAADAKKLIDAARGESHPLAGAGIGLPDTCMLVYPPRDETELAVTGQIPDAAMAHMVASPACPMKK